MNLLIIRLIIFAVLFYAGLKLYGIYRQRKLTHQQQTPTRHEGGQMVRCRWCDVHVPESEALRDAEQWFCCSAHRDRFLQEQEDNSQR
ncbi:PP0621 family protein [Halomonas sp. DWK9]|uniref:PP0621 family protein n=1 Tax=Halomonas sp. DWK9 TaxID=3060155 RepID=UPI00287FB93A|nr:PP0621 family protein [Halomonas sp. DWK9]